MANEALDESGPERGQRSIEAGAAKDDVDVDRGRCRTHPISTREEDVVVVMTRPYLFISCFYFETTINSSQKLVSALFPLADY
jgi:hypothetical protein